MLQIFNDGWHMIDSTLHNRLQKANNLLIQAEKEIAQRAHELDNQLKSDLIAKKDRMFDYELEVIIECFGANEDDYPLCVLRESLKGISSTSNRFRTKINDEINHNEFEYRENHPMRSEHHCWLFHCLYDHEHLSWEEIADIKYFWIDIAPRYQYRFDVQ
jgi:hypothetical protein